LYSVQIDHFICERQGAQFVRLQRARGPGLETRLCFHIFKPAAVNIGDFEPPFCVAKGMVNPMGRGCGIFTNQTLCYKLYSLGFPLRGVRYFWRQTQSFITSKSLVLLTRKAMPYFLVCLRIRYPNECLYYYTMTDTLLVIIDLNYKYIPRPQRLNNIFIVRPSPKTDPRRSDLLRPPSPISICSFILHEHR
jgi:hypothetical protein